MISKVDNRVLILPYCGYLIKHQILLREGQYSNALQAAAAMAGCVAPRGIYLFVLYLYLC